MKTHRNQTRRISLCLALLLVLSVLVPTQAGAAADSGEARWQDYNGKRIGVLVGPLMEDIAHTYFPDSEYLLFNSYPDCISALLAGKIDAYLGDEPGLKSVHAEQPRIDYIHDRITNQDYSFAFRKNDPESAALCEELNAFLARCREDGTMQELDDIWFGVDEERKVVDMADLSGKNGTIRVVTTSEDMPWSYIKDGKNVGYDIDLVVRFCRYAGYKLELGDVDFAARIPAIQSGKYDFTTDMNVTPEREEQVLFSDPTSSGGVVLAILSDGSPAGESAASAEQQNADKQPIMSLDRLAQPGITIAVGLDTPAEASLKQDYPEAKLIPYSDIFLAYLDVASSRVDACVAARREMEFALDHGLAGVRLLEETYETNKIAVGISPVTAIPAFKDKLNAFIAEVKADGTLDDMYDRWVTRGEETMPELPRAENPSFTLRVGTTGTVMPYSYYGGTELAGYDIELAQRFALWLGAELELKVYDFGGIIPAAEAGSIDCIMSNLFYTEEKEESIPFSDVLFEVEITAMVKDGGQDIPGVTQAGVFISLPQLNGKRIGVQTGTTFDEIVLETLPDAKISYFNTYPDMAAALEANKIDGFPGDEPVLQLMAAEDPDLTILSERMDSFEFGFVLPKTEAGAALQAELDAWIGSMQESGELQKTIRKWTEGQEADKTIPNYFAFPAPKGTLRMATEGAYAPMNYYRENEVVGMEIDLAAQFCEANGYGLIVEAMNFDGILPAVQTGKADFAAAGISITDERKESVNFSAAYYTGGTVMAVLKAQTNEASVQPSVFQTLSDLSTARVGIPTGTSFDSIVAASLPEAILSYYNNQSDLLLALSANKIDAFPSDEPVIRYTMGQRGDITYIPEYLDSFVFAYCFAKTEEGERLQQEFSEFIRSLKANGSLEALADKWFGADETSKTLPAYQALPAENGILRMATDGDYPPFEYLRDGQVVGYDVDIAAQFCQSYGYGLEIEVMNLDAVLPAVQSGKCSFGGSAITVTPERAESVLFSESNYTGGTVMVVLKAADAAEQTSQTATASVQNESFLDGITASFNKTFIRESRWKLFLEGIGTTMLITVLSILLGTALGFLLFLWCRNGNPFANGITRFCLWLVQGMPMVVLLMILYYVIFGSTAISGLAVAVIGFTLTFGASVFGMLKMGVGAVDRGQYEAAYALGHSNRYTFFKIILPQAIPHVLPAYQGEIVGLIKATAIVGYIAVQDLTKMGDIVRSRTYEAFFPLIAITVIYFVLEGLLSLLVSCIRIHIDPKKRKRESILKGVNTHD